MPRLWRSNSGVPISASNALTRWVTLDCTVLSSSAARVMPPLRATAAKVWMSLSSMASFRSGDGSVRYNSFLENASRAYSSCPDLVWPGGPMPITSSLTTLLEIKHPILLAPMDIVAGARLVTAVSSAGGFGDSGGGYGGAGRVEAETGK